MGTERLTMGQALVKYLAVQYSEFDGERRRLIPAIFGIFGHGNVCGLGQALEQGGGDLPYHQTRNEQSMVHTAAGFARATRRTQTLACTSSIGPGATNMVTGAATATINRIPVLLLASDYYATRHQGPVLQQLEHPSAADVSVNDCFRPVSRFFDRITRPEQLLTALPQAMRVLTDPAETGAVTLSLPQDVQAHAWDYPSHFFAERTWRIERRPPSGERIEEAVAMLKAAKRPVIIAGGGVHYSAAWDALRAVATGFGIPVSETHAGKGALRGAPEWSLGGHGVEGTSAAARIAEEADLVIAVGTRMSDFATASQSLFHDPEVRFIAVNVCALDAFKQGALPVVADARLALGALLAAGKGAGVAFPGYAKRNRRGSAGLGEDRAHRRLRRPSGRGDERRPGDRGAQRGVAGPRHRGGRGGSAARQHSQAVGWEQRQPLPHRVRLPPAWATNCPPASACAWRPAVPAVRARCSCTSATAPSCSTRWS